MAGIRKRTWTNKSGKHTCYEINCVINGIQVRKSGYKTKQAAQDDLDKVTKEYSSGVTIATLAHDYLERHCELNCKSSTKMLYENYLKVNLADIKRLRARDLKKRDIENLVLQLKTKGLQNKTINGIVTLLQAILNYGVDNGFLAVNPILKFKKLPQVKPQIHFLNETQQKVFLEQAKNCPETYYTFFYTALKTGMRRGELLALEWSDIDFNNAKIWINKQIYRGVTQSTKTGKERYVDMPHSLIDVLIEHKKHGVLSKYVFHTDGKPLHAWNMEETYFKPLLKRCNKYLDSDNQIIKLRFHDLRHSYASYLLSNGVPVKYVQERLGHATARMTLDVYNSIMPSVKYGALELLDNLQNSERIEHKLNTKN